MHSPPWAVPVPRATIHPWSISTSGPKAARYRATVEGRDSEKLAAVRWRLRSTLAGPSSPQLVEGGRAGSVDEMVSDVLCARSRRLLLSVDLRVVEPMGVYEWKLVSCRSGTPTRSLRFPALQFGQGAVHPDKGHPDTSEYREAIVESPVLAQDVIDDHVGAGGRHPSHCTVEAEYQTLVDRERFTFRVTVADAVAQFQIEVVDAHPDPDVVELGLQSFGGGRLTRTRRPVEEDHASRLG